MSWAWIIWGYVIGGVITFILVLVESKREELYGVSRANTFGILMMTPFWPFMLGGWVWRRFTKHPASANTGEGGGG